MSESCSSESQSFGPVCVDIAMLIAMEPIVRGQKMRSGKDVIMFVPHYMCSAWSRPERVSPLLCSIWI
jgi:hypothetical protein